jgi:methyl-accepting chemotaxis protein
MNEKTGQDAIAEAEKGFNASFDFLVLVVVVLLLAGLAASFWLAATAIKPLDALTRGFEKNVEQVAGHSEQVSAAATQIGSHLLESANQFQKAGNAMEQLVFMAQQNNQETVLARHYMEEAKSSITAGTDSAQKTVDYMKALSQGAEKVFQVVKTIEEIAFQTNILALNAGVEAVRAGDQGKEFVVVVEEIRNLSQRCSQVARETSKLVTDNARQTSEGIRLSEETGKALVQALEISGKAGNLLTVIEKGLENQTRGLHEVHKSTGNAEQEAFRNSAIGEKAGALGSSLAQQAEGLRQVSTQLAGLLEKGTTKPKAAAFQRKPAKAASPESQMIIPERGISREEMKMLEKTGTHDAKIVHMNK